MHTNWNIAQSNPCFEVWLYYHRFDTQATTLQMETCAKWKSFLTDSIPGGFDSRKHPIYIGDAIINSANHFEEADGMPSVGSTEVFRLAQVIQAFCRWKIENILSKI